MKLGLIPVAIAAVVLPVLAVACGTTADTPKPNPTPETDAGVGQDATVDPPDASDGGPAPVLTFPKAVSRGGTIIKSPKIIPIVFAGETIGPKIEDFTNKLGASAYWTETAGEYGVGAIVGKPLVSYAEVPPANLTDDDIKAWLGTELSKADGPLGAPDGETLYALFYPKATSIDLEGTKSCQGFGGYHNETSVGGTKVAYAVMPRCPSGGRISETDLITDVSSHEYFEWVTDPFPFTNPAFNTMDDEHWVWGVGFGGELSDLCTGVDFSGGFTPADLPYFVQRQWSNKLSLAGHFPCAPNREGAYFAGIPEQPDAIVVPDFSGNGNVKTKGVKMKKGETRVMDVYLYGDAPTTGPFTLQVVDSQRTGPNGFTYSLDSESASQGEHVKVTITATKTQDFGIFFVVARLGRQATIWPGLVVTQ
jgi:hypothetical protein